MRNKVLVYILPVVLTAFYFVWADVIPFDPARGLVEVQVKIDGRINGRFGIDTGADHLYIDRTFAQKNNLTIYSEMSGHEIKGVEGSSKGYYAQLRSLEIGGELLYNARAVVTDLAALGGHKDGLHPDGLIGFEVIRRFYVTVDYPHTLLQLYLGEPDFLNRSNYSTVPFRSSGHLVLMDVTFNDSITVPMILDFCASYTSVSPEVAAWLGLDPQFTGIQKVNKMSLSDVIADRDIKLVVRDFSSYQKDRKDRFEGIIGTSFLYQYKITIDYRRQKIYVHH